MGFATGIDHDTMGDPSMNMRHIGALCLAFACAGAGVASAQQGGWGADRGLGINSVCAQFPGISTTATAAPGLTNGIIGTPAVGDVYTVSVSGAGSGTFRIVGDPGGTVTYAGPATAPATLTYAVTSLPPPVGAAGVGFFFDAGSGTVTVTARCQRVSNVPGLSGWGVALLALGLLAVAVASGLRRHRGSA